ncbi:MAG: hypothetical protein K2X99_02315 [Gemmatimonadaceae bacterium]|nr:hypothetical protein [Gemmatimonadaceae bacterium]
MRRAFGAVVLALVASGCAYYNGVYNAKRAVRRGEALRAVGREGEAAGEFALGAISAETVLARYPRSRWRAEALYLAGRGGALGGDCGRGRGHLMTFLARPAAQREWRDRAGVALALCDLRAGRLADARVVLDSLAVHAVPSARDEAIIGAARAAIALGDLRGAEQRLARVDAGVAQWELAAAALAAGEPVRAESLMILRVRRGDARPDLPQFVRGLWVAGDRAAMDRVVFTFGGSRARSSDRFAAHLLAADLWMAARVDANASAHLLAARRLALDSVAEVEAGSRLTLLRLADRSRLEDVTAVVGQGRREGRGTLLQQRLEDNLLLVQILERRVDRTGAALFLAAEVARDSLRAFSLSDALFRRLEESGTVMASRAVLGIATVTPESASVVAARVQERFPRSPDAARLGGNDASTMPAYVAQQAALTDVWTTATRRWRDSLAILRPAPGGAARAGAPRRVP